MNKRRPSNLLSVQIESFIDSLDHEEDALNTTERLNLEKLIHVAAQSLEGFAEPWAKKLVELLRQDPDLWEWVVDEFYSRQVIDSLRGLNGRFLRLSPILIGIVPSKEVNLYLREATRCYIYGSFEASIALSRAALEAGLNEYLKRRLGAVPSQKLIEKVKKANLWKLLTSVSAGMAEDVSKAAGMVLHQRPAKSDQLAFDTLVRARGVLRELYQ